MYGYTYITTNLINGKKYIGQHKAERFDENYKGSGYALQAAIKKYGWENFETKVLNTYDTKEELNQAEIEEIQTRNAVDSEEYYNLANGGGIPSWLGVKERHPNYGKHLSKETREKIALSRIGKKASEETKKLMSLQRKGRPGTRKGIPASEETRKRMSETRRGKDNGFYGKHHSEKTRRYLSEINRGKSHPMYGMIWITNGEDSRKIFPKDFDKYEEQGYRRGRVLERRKYGS